MFDKSGRAFPLANNPSILYASFASLNKDNFTGSYVNSSFVHAFDNVSFDIVFPVNFLSSTLNSFIAFSLFLFIHNVSFTFASRAF